MRFDPKHPAVQLSLIAALAVAGYGRALRRGFVSEDFVILRLLSEGSFWEQVWAQCSGPWLGITFVKFYRPVSTFILQIEHLLWGLQPTGYLLFHFLVHLLNAALVYRLVYLFVASDGRTHRLAPFTAALLFAVYPLHPNTVVFVASFATLFSTTACLMSLLLFLQPRRRLGLSAATFALALGCYEGSAVLPGLLVSADLLATWSRRAPMSWRVWARYLPFAGLLAGFLALRSSVLGAAIGGYPNLEARLEGGDLSALLAPLQLDWGRLLYPTYEAARRAEWVGASIAVVLVLGTLWSLVRLRSGQVAPRMWLLAVVWIFVSQMPFDVIDAVPGNARYWYLTSIGLALMIVAAASAPPPPWRARFTVAVSVLLGGSYLVLLSHYSSLYVEAAKTAGVIRSEILRVTANDSDASIFVLNPAAFVRGARGTPVAQVFHWGLSDALRPPFAEREVSVYPLPRFGTHEITPVLERPALGRVWRWDGAQRTLVPVDPVVPGSTRRIDVGSAAPGDEYSVRFEAVEEARYRLVVLARGNPTFPTFEVEPGPDGWAETSLPAEFVTSMSRLYGGKIFWWIEAEDRSGAPVAFSEIQTLAVESAGSNRSTSI